MVAEGGGGALSLLLCAASLLAAMGALSRAEAEEAAGSAPIWTMPVAVGKGPSRRCGATTAKGQSGWKLYGYDGLQLRVPTAACKFPAAGVQYVSSLVGAWEQWQSTGTSTILRADADSFTLVVLHPSLRGNDLLAAAKSNDWRVSWVGDAGGNTGNTLPGKGGWRQGKTPTQLVLDVSTAANRYAATPLYFSAFRGFTNHWRVEGAHTVYFPKKGSFRVYLSYDQPILPAAAEKLHWQISWIGVPPTDPKAGQSGSDWKLSGDRSGISMDVDASGSKFRWAPTYVTATTTNYMHWAVYGGGSVYKPTRSGFRLMLATTATGADTIKPSLAKFYKWRVNYLGYDGPVACAASAWGDWGKCSAACDGVQTRVRVVVQKPAHGGAACPALDDQKLHCNLHKCKPRACRASSWSAWPKCSRTCGGGVTHRERTVVQTPAYGGVKCPPLTDLKACATKPCPVNCRAAPWSLWTKCDRRCGRAQQHRKRTVQTKASHGGVACPALSESRFCFGTKCIGHASSVLCGGIAGRNAAASAAHGASARAAAAVQPWRMVGTDAVALHVDTSLCAFAENDPVYVFDVIGLNNCPYFKTFSGSHTVLNATRAGFTAVVWLPNLEGTEHLETFAAQYGWAVSWLGEHGSNSGSTVPGKTKWQQKEGEDSTLWADVDTAGCEYAATPQYATSLHGASQVWRARGSNVVFKPTAKGFTVYVVAASPITPAQAEAASWTIGWIGFFTGLPTLSRGAASAGAAAGAVDGDVNTGWVKAPNGGGIFLNVPVTSRASGGAKLATPSLHGMGTETAFVGAISLPMTLNWELPGSMSLAKVGAGGFRMYLGNMDDGGVRFPDEMHWGVGYVAFEVVHCVLSPWSKYSACSHSCGGGAQSRHRTVLQRAQRGGRKCSALLRQRRQCQKRNCVGVGRPRTCGATTTADGTQWAAHGKHGMAMQIGTSFCQLRGQVQYAVSLIGDRAHWQLAGSSTIAQQSRSGVRVVVTHPTATAAQLTEAARTHRWRVSWIGATGVAVGVTNAGRTGWKQVTAHMWPTGGNTSSLLAHYNRALQPTAPLSHILYADVDTSGSGFADTVKHWTPPRYFPALLGFANQWLTHGSHVTVNPGRTSFRVYAVYPRPITPKQAEAFKWRVSWIGTSDNKRSGTGHARWTTAGGPNCNVLQRRDKPGACGKSAVTASVDTSSRDFHVNPTYVAALEALDGPWVVGGAANLFGVGKTGFDVYLSTAFGGGPPRGAKALLVQAAKYEAKGTQPPLVWDPAKYAASHSWRVNYIGYIGSSHVCGATTPPGSTAWQKYGSLGLYLDVDASYCNFKRTPQFMANVMGVNKSPFFGYMRGTTVVQSASPTRFRVIVYYPALSGYNLLDYSKTYSWHLAWLADTGSSSGITKAGATGWKAASGLALSPALRKAAVAGGSGKRVIMYVDVDVSRWKFVTTPRYFTMLRGAKQHVYTQGSNVVLAPTPTGFRVFVVYAGSHKRMTPALAEQWGWQVSWMADTETYSGTSQLGATWQTSSSGQGVYMDIDTGDNGFKVCPTYVACMWQPGSDWAATSLQSVDMSVDEATYTSFRVYLDMSTSAFAAKRNWRVNYVGYEVIDCRVSDWLAWSGCDKTCGGGQRKRKRTILQVKRPSTLACAPPRHPVSISFCPADSLLPCLPFFLLFLCAPLMLAVSREGRPAVPRHAHAGSGLQPARLQHLPDDEVVEVVGVRLQEGAHGDADDAPRGHRAQPRHDPLHDPDAVARAPLLP